jgi:hypothetical protein
MIALRHNVTCFYLNSRCDWVPSLDDAHDFGDTSAAERFCLTHGLSEVEVLVIFEDGPCLVLRLESWTAA